MVLISCVGGIRSGIEGAVHAMNDLFAQHQDSVPG